MSRSNRRWLVGIASLVGVGLALWYFWLQPSHEHLAWSIRMYDAIRLLHGKRPEKMTPNEWEHLASWTQNLHANCGWAEYWSVGEGKWLFLEEFEARLQGQVDAGTIDWFWDEYARRAPRSQRYVDLYRPTRPRPDGR